VEEKTWNRSTLTQSISFGLIGLLNAAVDFSVFFLLVRVLHWNVILSQSVSYACGIGNSYLCNRYLTFARRNRPHYAEIMKFIAVCGVSYGISVYGLYIFRKFPWPLVVCKVFATLIAFVVNFVGSKWWVFRPQKIVYVTTYIAAQNDGDDERLSGSGCGKSV
jgi:putative flippase GtrA